MRALLCGLGLACLAPGAMAAAFQADSVVVLRVGDGVARLGSSAAATYLDEYSWSGTLRQSILLPLTESGDSPYEGKLSLSADGQALVVPGYGVAVGAATASNNVVARQVVTVEAAGVTRAAAAAGVTSRVYSAAAAGAGPTSYMGSGSGVFYVNGQGGAVKLASGPAYDLAIAGGQLYATMGLATEGIYAVGNGLPTSAPASLSLVVPLALPSGLAVFDLHDQVDGADTLYAVSLLGGQAEDGTGNTGLYKYSKQASGAWTLTGHLTADLRSLDARLEPGGVRLVGTSGTLQGNQLLGWVDTGGWGAMGAGSFTTLATAASRTGFRGASMAPGAVPEPNTVGMVLAGLVVIGLRGRHPSRR